MGSEEINVTEPDGNKMVRRFDSPQAGLAESGLPSATIEVRLVCKGAVRAGLDIFIVDKLRRLTGDQSQTFR